MANWKQTRRTLRRPFETGLFMATKALVPLLPRRAIVGLAKALGHLGMVLPIREKSIGMKNLDAVFGNTKSVREKRRILASSFATFSQTMLDVLWFSVNPEKRIGEYVEFKNGPLKDRFLEDRPLICITAHMGSWELMGQTCALLGADLASIAAPIKNKMVDRLLIGMRERTGQTIIPRKGALRALIARLRKNGKAAFVLDQNTSPENGGIKVDFLGLPMMVSSAPAALAYRTGTEIMLGFCRPCPGGKYLIEIACCIQPPPFDKAEDPDNMALELTRLIEDNVSEQIRKYPEYWLWSYKHWRRYEGNTYPSNYPHY
ncbi:Lipid A biosynthesis palmitoleoyltransferase [Pontiella desulfatans]|uniref:Lipid A biosynthesis palmitoleoyltransferase n=1 Tax=Pontiella desulfatans TaxID=2750659 RepID=A0A6C2TXH7_PONDE|nr:lysophospholipid acyltransferase family protein [Pontiella desulfatans]VGO12287.1 Lipid A biosynthesis palmitoleoyltransferase [Pontiella desulfatans]